jgi:hypothetical protein
MKSFPAFLVLLFLTLSAFGQSKINIQLQKQIKIMFTADQKWRIEAQNVFNGKTSVYKEAVINRNMTIADSINMIKAKAIIAKYGFPGFDLVGEDYNNNFWAIIQHCDDDVKFQQHVLVLLKKQVELHNASAENYALLEDRVLINTGKKQLFGTRRYGIIQKPSELNLYLFKTRLM